MAFSTHERGILLGVKGVGPRVIQRLEALGFHTLQQLAAADALEIVSSVAGATGASCWKNSPQARAAIQAAIDRAKSGS